MKAPRKRTTAVLALGLLSLSCSVARPPSVSTEPPTARRGPIILPVARPEPARPEPTRAEIRRSAQEERVAAVLGRHADGLSPEELGRVSRTIVEEAESHRLDPALVLAVIEVESRFDSFAVSPAGAMGLMQILPSTGEALAESLGIPWRGARTLFDPVANVRMGVAYLQELRARFGELGLALVAYNRGPGAVHRVVARGDPVPRGYSRRVLAAWERRPLPELSAL